jgi:toxin ParE1/3/4
MSQVIKTPPARQDLIELWKYIAEDSPSNADRVLDRIEHGLERLADNPEMGRRRPGLRDDLRSFSVGNHVIFYRPLSKQEGVEVVRVLHGAQDIDSQF